MTVITFLVKRFVFPGFNNCLIILFVCLTLHLSLTQPQTYQGGHPYQVISQMHFNLWYIPPGTHTS